MLHRQIEERLRAAVAQVAPEADPGAILVRPCPDARFGDYQTNALMALAKARRTNPRQLAQAVADAFDAPGLCDQIEVAGPGFLNFRLTPQALVHSLTEAARGRHLFFATAAAPQTVILDFSSPNVAKPMHVGHIRSTILGDALARTFRLLGHRVITDNHIGDWGTQFGMLLVGWKTLLDPAALERDPIAELERIYRAVNARCSEGKPEFDRTTLEQARGELVRLQAGDAENTAIWRRMIALSQEQFATIYGRLGVRFDHALGESFYNDRLAGVVRELESAGIVRESEGALVAFFDDLPQLQRHPAIVRKSDGAANYTTTDLATLQYRLTTWNPDAVIYVTDGRQQLHFQQVFEIFRRWQPQARVRPAHVWFGSILGEDNRPLKTRSGENIKLADLLDEAEERALQVVAGKNPDLPEPEQRQIARMVGIGAVKYADLLPNRQSDYVFSWDKMLALNGNTAPYLLYAATRIRSIFRKLAESGETFDLATAAAHLTLNEPAELALAKHLHGFDLVLHAVAEEHRPNYLCNYLYELAGQFTGFYEACPVLRAEDPVRTSRLVLCELTLRVLARGLHVLGLELPDRM
ncbi:MAG: arginine--tRNA ligase [Verrucomicrobiales bacterium]|nr:arginine--tRNA ligase [Verrucomicrobiales bacterium]MCP5528533.1 arginine--tRNA ligase [Verrucomicrobiales bacterium]